MLKDDWITRADALVEPLRAPRSMSLCRRAKLWANYCQSSSHVRPVGLHRWIFAHPQPLLSSAADHRVGRKERAVVASLFGVVLLVFEFLLIARMAVDWIGVLSPVA